MVAASQAGVRFVVLDRPNPITGVAALGPVMHPEYASFVGLKAISQQHGMTIGELAKLFNGEFLPKDGNASGSVPLSVVQVEGWRRDMWQEETGQPWVMPSPNMPRVETTRPFELIGAPYVDYPWADALRAQDLPGVEFREAHFVPLASKHLGVTCTGVQLHVTVRDQFEAIRTAIAMIITAKRLYPDDFAWRESRAPYWIDKLTGSDQVRVAIDSGADVDEVVAGWQRELAQFRRTRRHYLLYPTAR